MSQQLFGAYVKGFRYNGKAVVFGEPFDVADSHAKVLVALGKASYTKPVSALTSAAALISKPTPTPTTTVAPLPTPTPVVATANEGESTGTTDDDEGDGETDATGDGNDVNAPSESDSIASLRDRYKTQFGSAPDGRWSKARIIEELTKG